MTEQHWLYECDACGTVTIETEPIEDVCPVCEEDVIVPVECDESGEPLTDGQR